MNYATGYASSLNDLLVRFPYEKLNSLKGTKVQKKKIIKQIFKESIKTVLQDIIDTNCTFIIPSMGLSQGEIHMDKITDSEFEKLRKIGKFKDVDFLESLFTGYQLSFFWRNKTTKFASTKKKPIYVNKFFKSQITKNTNEGKQY